MTLPSRLRAAALAGAVAIAGAAAPAPASALDRDALRVIAGLIALGVVAKVVDDRLDRRRDEARERERSRDDRFAGHRPAVAPDRHRPRAGALPAACLRDVVISRGVDRVVGAGCLSRRGVRAALPSRCATRVHAGGRERRAYGARCLRDAGFVFR